VKLELEHAVQPQEEVVDLPHRSLWSTLRPDWGVGFASIVLLVVLVAVAFPSVIASGDPNSIELGARLLAPGVQGHLLGTDPLGHDVFTQIIYGARLSILIALAAVAISATVGVLFGLLSGYYGGAVDILIMRWTDVQLSFPFILLGILVFTLFGGGIGVLILVLAISGWTDYARVVRSQVLSVKQSDHVQAAKAIGVAGPRMLRVHILPLTLSSIIVLVTLNTSINILFEAALTFLGLGLSPETPTWGGILSDGRVYLSSAWWISTFPGLAIMLTTLAINMLGDWLRDRLNPRMQQV
jgi:peptide/nickel transport system permease protein